MSREALRCGLSVPDRTCAFLGGAVGGALAIVSLHLLNARWPSLLDSVRPH